MTSPIIHWFRRDLRLSDNLALSAAAQTGQPVIPVFIFDPRIIESRRVGLPRLAFLLKALEVLDETLRKQGSRLLIRYGDPRVVLSELIQSSGAAALYFNRDYTPFARKRDAEIESLLPVPAHGFDDAVLLPPGSVMTEAGKPFTVFTPFKKKWLTFPKAAMVEVLPEGAFVSAEVMEEYSVGVQQVTALLSVPTLTDLGHPTTISVPAASETEAQRRLNDFLARRVYAYAEGRNQLAAQPGDDTYGGSSFLSPYLRFGLLSPRQAYWSARTAYQQTMERGRKAGVESWVSELIWREFYMQVLYHFPHVMKGNFKPQYDRLEWRSAPDELAAWKVGQTGFPVVDAAMRQLTTMGWMPNRTRMIVASFLAKDLLVHWQEGERHFMDWLIDGDPAANNGGWQWSAGTGTDAQPYFRIFNPVSQGQKFDPDGVYVRRWIPELRDVPDRYLHTPWEMSAPPGEYPPPIVDRSMARERALAAFKAAVS